MTSENSIPVGITKRRKQRWASKKRKLEAFLTLVSNEEAKLPKLEEFKSAEIISDESMKQIRQASAAVRPDKDDKPSFYLTEHGLNAQVNFTFYNKEKPLGETIAPLFVLDIQQLVLKALLGNSMYNFRWGKIEFVKKISHVVLFIIDGLSKDDIIRNMTHFSNALEIFPDMVEVLTSLSYCLNFATELCGVHLILGYKPKPGEQNDGIGVCTSHKPLTGIFPGPKEPRVIVKDFDNVSKEFSKLHLLLNPLQLALENFPLPESVLEGSNTKGYSFTKDVYAHVTAESPMFALDCEMCRMKSGKMEVIKISLVNEKLNLVYSTLVKPKGHVADYLTKYSGVDREMLLPVKITLSDVQQQLKTLLPPDAILCGQSLNFDLHALKMIHPYIVDTSVIYNMSGRRTKKAGLRVLSEVFLSEVIQDSEKGHDPTEDCIAAMKLVQLKLKNGPIFGDAILADCKKINNNNKIKQEAKDGADKNHSNEKSVNGQPPLESQLLVEKSPKEPELSVRFFSKLQNAGKKLCIVADALSYPQYSTGMVASSINKIVETSMKKVIKKSTVVMNDNHLTVCHINPITCQKITDELNVSIDKYIKKLYNACKDKSLFITVATGASKKDAKFENALCMVCLKNEK